MKCLNPKRRINALELLCFLRDTESEMTMKEISSTMGWSEAKTHSVIETLLLYELIDSKPLKVKRNKPGRHVSVYFYAG